MDLENFGRCLVIACLTVILITLAFTAGFISNVAYISSHPLPTPTPTLATEPSDTETKAFKVFWEAWHLLQREFYGPLPDPQRMTYDAIRGVVNGLGDENTAFVPPDLAAIFNEDLSGSFEGIGALVDMDESGQLIIVEPFEGRPADLAGVKAGDVVIKVDDIPIQGKSLYEAIALIRGPAGTTVHLTIKRKGLEGLLEIDVVRARIEIPIVRTSWPAEGIAYLRLTEFNGQAAEHVHAELARLLKEKPDGLIFDLRGNPGGYLHVAVQVASEFLRDGNVLIERTKNGEERTYPVQKGGIALDVPLVVLVNESTASASEIVAGALQDAGRAVIIGTRTFGKGSVQIPYTLSDGSGLRVTVAHWFTPAGRQIHQKGLTPDIVVEYPESAEAGRDPQLDRAIQYLREHK